jgi:hypothetical protein
METHGGFGRLYGACYTAAVDGVVFENNPIKAEYLAQQRPRWAVYEADCEKALRNGVGAHLEVSFLDLDPYGEPWPVMDAFFQTERPRAKRLALAVNDGLRQKLKMNSGWAVHSLEHVVRKYGNGQMYERYLEICRELVIEKAAIAGYSLKKWAGYYCGFNGQMTHYGAVLERSCG